MLILCPHCQCPTELDAIQSGQVISCSACGSTFQLATGSTRDWQPRKLGRFELLEAVGVGDFGTVYRGRDPQLDRPVAIKVPRSGHFDHPQEHERFLREARNAAQLRHPSIVAVHEVGEEDGLPFLVCEFIEGITLTDLLSKQRPVPREAAHLLAAIADALYYAHQQGVVHRDVKPSNLLLQMAAVGHTEPHSPNGDPASIYLTPLSCAVCPKIADFGLAKREAGEITMTVEGQVLGTPAYMSPEQAAGESHKVDGRTDVYSLGVILYQMLTGELPFRGTTRMLLHQVLHDEPRPPRGLNDRVPRDLETICLKAMAKEPSRRYPTAGVLADDLRRFLAGEPILARPVGRLERLARWCRRKPMTASLTAALVLTVAAGLTGVTWKWREAEANYNEKSRQEGIAQENRELAEERLLRFRKRAYWSDMNLAYQAWDKEQLVRLHHLLDTQTPPPGQRDLRGFEWHCLQQLCRQEKLSLPAGRHNYSVGLSPDGTRLASGNDAGTIKLYETASGKELAVYHESQPVRRLAFTGDGRSLVYTVGIWQGEKLAQVKVRDLTTGQVRDFFASKHLHDRPVALALASRRAILAVGFYDGETRVWDMDAGVEPLYIPPFGSSPCDIALTPDGRTLAVNTLLGKIQIWDVPNKKQRGKLQGRDGSSGNFVALSPDGKLLAAPDPASSALILWDVDTLTQTGRFGIPGGDVNRCIFSTDGQTLAVAYGSGNRPSGVQLWDVPARKLLTTLHGHRGGIHALALGPDGKVLASSGEDDAVKLWDVDRFLNRPPLPFHNTPVVALAITPDGNLAASGSKDGAIKLWEVGVGREMRTLVGHTAPIAQLAFAPNGKRLASGCRDGTGRLWDLADGATRWSWSGAAKESGRLAFSPDGAWLVRTDGAQVVLMDAVTGARQKEFRCPAGVVCDVALAGGCLYATTNDGTLHAWDMAGGEARSVRSAHKGAALAVAVSPDGQFVASSGTDGFVRLWQAPALKEWAVLRGHKGAVESLAFAADGKLLSAGVDGSIRGWDINAKAEVMVLSGHAGGIHALACPRQRLQALSAGEDRRICLWDVQDRKWMGSMGERTVQSLSCLPDGRTLALGRGSELALRDLDSGKERRLVSELSAPVHVACSGDGKLLAASVGRHTYSAMDSTAGHDVLILDAVTGKRQRVLKGHEGGTVAVAFAPDGKLLAAGAIGPRDKPEGVKVRLWDLESGRVRHTLTHRWPTASLAFSPGGTLLAVGTSTIWFNVPGELRLWDVATGKETARLNGHLGGISSVAFSPDGKVLASAGQDHVVKIWDVAGGKLLRTLEGSSDWITAVAFAPDGSRLAAAGHDGILRLWETEDYNEVFVMRLSERRLESLAFTSDGRTLAVGCYSYVPGDELRLLRAEDPDERRASEKRENP